MLVRRLWHKLAILAASNAPAVRSHTSLKVGTGITSANALSPQGRSRAELELELANQSFPFVVELESLDVSMVPRMGCEKCRIITVKDQREK